MSTIEAARRLAEKLDKDLEVTAKALEKVAVVAPQPSHLYNVAQDYLQMARTYYQDAQHFREQGNLVDGFGAVNYAHGWLDAGARLGIFDVDGDYRLFTLLH